MATRSGTLDEIRIVEPICAVFRRKLKSEGLKYTPERAQVLDAILARDGVFEAESVIDGIRASGRRVSKATVYRTIKLLLDSGIIQRVLFDEEQSHYELVYGRAPRDVLVRMDTRELIPIEIPELQAIRERVCRERGLMPAGHRFQVFASGPARP